MPLDVSSSPQRKASTGARPPQARFWDAFSALGGSTTTGFGGNRVVFTEVYQKREVGVRVRSNF